MPGNVIPTGDNHGGLRVPKITTNKKDGQRRKLILNFPSWGVCVLGGMCLCVCVCFFF